jgi:short-subunit dehydrogenase involved in D-alanine esterification of teichoic acids
MASRLISSGVKVSAVGRRKERLEEFVSKHGEEKASSMVFDIADLEAIPSFAETYAHSLPSGPTKSIYADQISTIRSHPTIDCIFLNAGIQHRCNFTTPEKVDLARFNREITTNFTSFVSLTHAFLPHLLSKSSPTGIIYTGSHISLIPASPLPAYSASKAALDAFVMCLRDQLASTNIRVTNISAPPVQTELHDLEMGVEAGRKMGMPVELFTEEAYGELVNGTENIVIGNVGGSSKEQFLEIAEKRQEAFERLTVLLRSHGMC